RANGKRETVVVPERRLYGCKACGSQFTVTTGTLFHDTHLPLRKWFYAIGLSLNSPQMPSVRRLQRELAVSYKTAWYLLHRIRGAIESEYTPHTGMSERAITREDHPTASPKA